MNTDKLNVGEYYWLRVEDDVFIGQYTSFFEKGFYVTGMIDIFPVSEVIILGKVSTEIIE